jgi:hypothetical protein
MKIRVFTLRFDADRGGFDDAALTSFLEQREALAVSEHFFPFEGIPTLALVV